MCLQAHQAHFREYSKGHSSNDGGTDAERGDGNHAWENTRQFRYLIGNLKLGKHPNSIGYFKKNWENTRFKKKI